MSTLTRKRPPLLTHGLLLALVLCLLSLRPARADDLLDIYELARQNDPLLQAAHYGNLATRESLRQAYSGFLPTLNAGAEFDLTRQEITKSDNPLFSEGTSEFASHDLNVTLSQPLFHYEALVGLRLARGVVARSALEYMVAEQELILRVAELYLEALSAQDDLGFARSEQAALQLHYERAQGQQARGLIPVTDLYDAQARLAAAQERQISAKNAQDDALEALREVSGDWVGSLAGTKKDLPLGPPDPTAIEQWIEAGLEQNLALQVQEAAVEVAGQEVKRRQAGHLPSLDLVARANRGRTGGDLFGDGRDTEVLNVRVQLNVPLYQGGLISSQVNEATYIHQRARKEHERLTRSVERATRAAYWGVISAIGRVEALQQSVTALELALDGRQKGFRSGLFSSLEVLDGVRDLFLSRRDHAQARYDYILNSLRLKQMVGTLSKKDIVAVNQWLVE